MISVRDDPKPLPRWQQRRLEALARWRKWRSVRRIEWERSRNVRHRRLTAFKRVGHRVWTLAISLVGATLVSFGVSLYSRPAGLIGGGLLLWASQWNYGTGRGEG